MNNSGDNISNNREYDISVNEESERYFDGRVKPKVKQFVEYQLKDTNDLKCVQVISRGGKATGKYSSWYTVRNVTDDVVEPIDWNNVQKWKLHVLHDEVLASNIGIDDIDLAQAKSEELQKWKENNVYETVPYRGQKLISVKWVNTSKFVNSERRIKSRSLAHGFPEKQDDILTDSPTCAKESLLRLILSVISSKKWTCQSIDITTAFL